MTDFKFYRRNVGDPENAVLSPKSESEVRVLLSASVRNVDRAISTLKRGKEVRTSFAVYMAVPAQKLEHARQ